MLIPPLFFLILGASVPYLLHMSMANVALVESSESIDPSEVPEWILVQLPPIDENETLHMVQLRHARPEVKTTFITTEMLPGLTVWVIPSGTWRLEKRMFPRLEEQSQEVSIGELLPVKGFWERVERIVAYNETVTPFDLIGAIVYYISLAAVAVGPPFLGLYVLRSYSGELKLWHLMIMIWIYTIFLFILGRFSVMDPSHETSMLDYIGYAAFVMPVIAYEVRKYEKSEAGRDFLKRLWGSRHKFEFERD